MMSRQNLTNTHDRKSKVCHAAINVHIAFCRCYAVTSAVTQLHYYVSDLLTSACKHVNDSFC